MSRVVQGVVSDVSGKPWKDTRSGKDIVLFSFKVEGGATWFRNGTNPLPFGKGQSVKFVVDEKNNVDKGSLEVLASAVQPVAAPAVTTAAIPSAKLEPVRSATSAANSVTRDEYWTNKEARDLEKDARYEAVDKPRMALSVATQAAANVIVAALQHDALSFGNAAKGKRVGMLAAFTKELALELADFIEAAPTQLAEYRKYKATVTPVAQDSAQVATADVNE